MDSETRPYPAWWLERAGQRRTLLDAAIERLRHVARADADIVGMLVFGSYAAGRVGPESDLDLIVVTTRAAGGDPGRRYAEIVKRLALGIPCDLLIYEPHEFERLSRESSFLAQARREGMWIDATTSA